MDQGSSSSIRRIQMSYMPRGGGIDFGRSTWPAGKTFGHGAKHKTIGDWYGDPGNAWKWNPGAMARMANKVTRSDIQKVLSAIRSASMSNKVKSIDATKILAALFGRPARTVPKVKGGGVSTGRGRGGFRGRRKQEKGPGPQYRGIRKGKVSYEPPISYADAQKKKKPVPPVVPPNPAVEAQKKIDMVIEQAAKRWGVTEPVAAARFWKRRKDGMPTIPQLPTNTFGWGAGVTKTEKGKGTPGANTARGGFFDRPGSLASALGRASAMGSIRYARYRRWLANSRGRRREPREWNFVKDMGYSDAAAAEARVRAGREKIGGYRTLFAKEQAGLDGILKEKAASAALDKGVTVRHDPKAASDWERDARDREYTY